MEVPELPIDDIVRGWTPHLHKCLAALDGRVSIEWVWRPTLQRLDDQSLIEVIANCGDLWPKEKRLANECMLWMRIICVSELADIGGVGIPI